MWMDVLAQKRHRFQEREKHHFYDAKPSTEQKFFRAVAILVQSM